MSFGGGSCHDLSHLTLTLFAVFINLGMAVLQEHLSVAASVSNPYCFCYEITTKDLFIMIMILGLIFIA